MAKNKTTKEEKQSAVGAFIIKQFRSIAIVLGIVFIAAIYFLIIQPERAKLLGKGVEDIALVTQEKQIKEATLNRLRQNLNEFSVLQEHNSEVLRQMLPPIAQKEEVFFTLSRAAAPLNLYLSSLNVEEPITAEEYFGAKLDVPLPLFVVPVSVVFRGPVVTYDGLKIMLGILHSRYGIFNIKELEFGDSAPAPAGEVKSGGELKLTIDVFFISDETPSIETSAAAPVSEE